MSDRQRLRIWCFQAFCMMSLFNDIHWTHAQIATDGTVGLPEKSLDPFEGNYSIGPELGEIAGNNLFHSFKEFNLKNTESATFTGPENISNVFSRVTGGIPSDIDGLIESKIDRANFFFMNPAGVIFGPNAQLDISGSFFVTTADSIEFREGQSFQATEPQGPPLLTSELPVAFGFLENNTGSLTVNGSNLKMNDTHSLSIVGGDITVDNGKLTANEGAINLISINSKGSASVYPFEISTSPDSDDNIQFGNITLANTEVKTEVRGTANGGDITVESGNLFVKEGSTIQSITKGIGAGGDIFITATSGKPLDSWGSVLIEGMNAKITTSTELPFRPPGPSPDERSGSGGSINIDTGSLDLINGGGIITLAAAGQSGNGGDIIINVQDTIRVDGKLNASIANATVITAQTRGAGNSGNISIDADNLEVVNRGQIQAKSDRTGTGDPGSLTLNIDQRILINHNEESNNIPTILGTPGDNFQSSGGTVTIKASVLEVLNGAEITSESGLEMGGDIDIDVTRLDINAGIISANASRKDGGQIVINSKNTIQITNSSRISAEADGDGGNIELDAPGRISVQNSEVTANSGNNGGNISINATELIFNASQITARAEVVSGGNIRINAKAFIQSSDNVIDVSVADKFGISGNVEIFAADMDIAGNLAVLPESFWSEALELQESCAVKLPGDFSSFIAVGRGGIPLEPGGIMPACMFFHDAK